MTDLMQLLKAIKQIEQFSLGIPQEIEQQRHEHALRLASAGWSYPSSLSLDQIELLATKELCDDEIDEYMVKIYCHEDHKILKEMINDSVLGEGLSYLGIDKRDLSKWEQLLRESLQCFLDKRYLITIPALVSIVEGILCEILEIDGTRVIHPTKQKSEETHAMKFEETTWNTILTTIETLYEPIKFDSPNIPELNRHWIMHGRATPKDTKVASLKLFNIVGTLATC